MSYKKNDLYEYKNGFNMFFMVVNKDDVVEGFIDRRHILDEEWKEYLKDNEMKIAGRAFRGSI